MLARKYTKRIELWQTVEIADGFGGWTVAEDLLSKQWARVVSQAEFRGADGRQTDLGVTDYSQTAVFTFRYRNDIVIVPGVTFIKYGGYKWVISRYTPVDFREVDIQVTATRERLSPSNTPSQPIANDGFPYTLPFNLS